MPIDNILDVERRRQYTASAAQTDFDYTFAIFDQDDLVVDVDGVVQTITTDYTVSGVGDDTGGTITFVVPMAGGETVTLYSDTEIGRLSDIPQNGPLASSTLNDELDKLTVIAQEIRELARRGIRLPYNAEVDSADLELSPIANWINKYIYIGANGVPEPSDAIDVTALSQSVVANLLNPQSTAEASAGVTATSTRFIEAPIIPLERYGMSATANGATNRQALEQAIEVARVLGGGILQAPAGVITVDATVTIDVDNVVIRGIGRGTIWMFNPGSTDVLFDFDNGVSSIMFGGVKDCRFHSSNSNNKTAVRCQDGRSMVFENLVMSDSGWAGSGSIGIHMLGRDSCVYRKNQLRCARPYFFDVNPNEDIHTDFFLLQDNVDGSTLSTGTTYEFADGVTLTNITFDHCATVLGKWGVKWADTTSNYASYNVLFRQCRFEQASDATGYSIELTSTAQRLQEVLCENVHFDVARNGLKLRNFERATLINSQFAGAAGVTNLDLTFKTFSELNLVGTHVQVGSTVTLTDSQLTKAAPFNAAETVISKTANYRFAEASVINQRPSYGMNSLKKWSYQGTLANNATLSTPITRALYTCAIVKVSAYSATGPIHCGGAAVWTKDGTTTKIGGSANFVVAAAGVELRCLDGGSGLNIINVLGQDVTIAIDIEFT